MADQVVGIKINVEGADAGKSVGSLKSQLREAQKAVGELSEKFGATSQAAIDAAKKAAKLKDAIGDAKTLTDAFNPDAKFKAFSSALQGVVGGFTAVQGAQALFGSESEDLTKTLAKVQGAMAFSQGIDSVLEAKDSFVTLGAKIKTNVVTAFNSLKASIGATGIGLLVIGLGLLVANFDKVKKAVMNLIPGLSSVADFIGGLVNKVTDFIGVTSESGRITEKLISDNEKAIKNGERFLDLNADKYDEYTQRKIKANLEFKKKQNEFLEDEKLSEAEKNEYIRQAREKANREILKSDEDRISKASEARKKETDKIKEDERKKEEERLAALNAERKKFNDEALQLQKDLIVESSKIGKTQQQIEEEELKRKYDAQIDILKKGGQQTALAQFVYLEELKKIREKYATDEVASAEMTADQLSIVNDSYTGVAIESAKARIKWSELEASQKEELLQRTAATLSQVAGIVGKETAAGKALAIAAATIDTYQAANSALKANYGIFGPAAQVARFVSVAATIAAGLKNVREIAKVKVPGGGGGGGNISTPSMPGISAPVGMAPSNTLLNQQLINQQGNAAVRSFVLESDVSGNQERIRRLNRAARIN